MTNDAKFFNAYWPFGYVLGDTVYSDPSPNKTFELCVSLLMSCNLSLCMLWIQVPYKIDGFPTVPSILWVALLLP